MDSFGDLFGGLGEIIGDLLGDGVEEAGAAGMGAMFASGGRRRGEEAPPIVYERYLCGGPRTLNLNDR